MWSCDRTLTVVKYFFYYKINKTNIFKFSDILNILETLQKKVEKNLDLKKLLIFLSKKKKILKVQKFRTFSNVQKAYRMWRFE
jgi:hypothetical protein